MSDTLQSVTEPTFIPSVTRDEAETIFRLREQLAALASAVDGLYDELEKLTLHKPGDRLSAGGVTHLATLIADARRLLPADIHLDRVARLLGDPAPRETRDARSHRAQVVQALRRAGGREQYSRRADDAVPSHGTAPGELELWLAGHTG